VSKEIKVVENPGAPTEVMAEHIIAISQGIKKLVDGPLKLETLVILIQHASGYAYGRGRSPSLIPAKIIKAVLAGISSLEAQYLKPKKK